MHIHANYTLVSVLSLKIARCWRRLRQVANDYRAAHKCSDNEANALNRKGSGRDPANFAGNAVGRIAEALAARFMAGSFGRGDLWNNELPQGPLGTMRHFGESHDQRGG